MVLMRIALLVYMISIRQIVGNTSVPVSQCIVDIWQLTVQSHRGILN